MSRPARPHPRDLVPLWPAVESVDPVAEVARLFAENLRVAISERSARAVAKATGVDHTTILAILSGRSWPDLYTIAKLEQGLDAELWPRAKRRK